MKKGLFSTIALLLIAITVFAQSPHQFKYQAVLRDADGLVLALKNVNIEIAILKGSETGTVVFSESHAVETNEFGLIQLNVGSLLNGTGSIAGINWSVGPYFMQVSLNGNVLGVKQLLSVPYALYADVADSVYSFSYNDLSDLPDFSNWDQNVDDDFSGIYDSLKNKPVLFDGDYASLKNKPKTITEEQAQKINYLNLTRAIDLDSLKSSVDSNSVKVSFPGFGTTAGTALEGNTPRWTYANGNMYHLGKVGANIATTQFFGGEVLRVGGGIVYDGFPSKVQPGLLFYNSQGDGSFRYYNNNYQERIIGKDSITFIATDYDTLPNVGIKSNFVVKGSMAIGTDAVRGEAFGFNTLILKENNLRILLDDTDDPESGFPYNDWILEANDNKNGGNSYFAIKDETSQSYPFKVLAGAGDNSLFIAENGHVGIGTSKPEEQLEVNGSIKASAFIGDGSGLSGITGAVGGISNADTTLIAADTDSDSVGEIVFQTQHDTKMTITNNGNVGIGTTSPLYKLDVAGTARFEELVIDGNIELKDLRYSIESDTSSVDQTLTYDVLNKSVITFGETSGNVTINGFENGVAGQSILLINKNPTSLVTIQHAGNIKNPGSVELILVSYASARYIYDGSLWYCIGKNF